MTWPPAERPLSHVLTRRQALQAGALAGLSTMLAGPFATRAAAAGTAPYLRRSSYAALVGEGFTIDGGSFVLASVSDLAGATHDASLVGHEDAFVLEFDGPPGALGSGIHNFSQPGLGDYSLFAGPVGQADGATQRYEVVIDRSVGRPADAPSAPEERIATPDLSLAAADEPPAASGAEVHTGDGAVAARTTPKAPARRKHRKARHVAAKPRKAVNRRTGRTR
jgi:hypothetical protein